MCQIHVDPDIDSTLKVCQWAVNDKQRRGSTASELPKLKPHYSKVWLACSHRRWNSFLQSYNMHKLPSWLKPTLAHAHFPLSATPGANKDIRISGSPRSRSLCRASTPTFYGWPWTGNKTALSSVSWEPSSLLTAVLFLLHAIDQMFYSSKVHFLTMI